GGFCCAATRPATRPACISSGSPPGSSRCCGWSRPAGRTRRSLASCSSRPRRPACTCRTSWPSWVWAIVVRRPPPPTGCTCSTRTRRLNACRVDLQPAARRSPAGHPGLPGWPRAGGGAGACAAQYGPGRQFSATMAAIAARLPLGLARIVPPTLLGFAVISTGTFGSDLALLTLLHGQLHWPLPAALTLAYLAASGLGYLLNRALNFRSHAAVGP